MFRMHDVHAGYGATPILFGVSLEVREGEAVALLGRLGYLDEALKLAREAHGLDPGLQTALALAGTHAARNELDQALQVYREALGLEPGDVSARVQMADLLVHQRRPCPGRGRCSQ